MLVEFKDSCTVLSLLFLLHYIRPISALWDREILSN